MTTRYRVEYALKSHRRDSFIEWIKGLTATPFVLHAGSNNFFKIGDESKYAADARRKYAEIFSDVEDLVREQLYDQQLSGVGSSRLKQMVPSIGAFFTPLPLERAFYVQDEKRAISNRRMVAPSFNDIRMILNTAQAMALSGGADKAQLITFDGDVTLYNDGESLLPGDEIVARLLGLLRKHIYVGVVTAAGYPDPSGKMYAERLSGLLEGIMNCPFLTPELRSNLLIMGGECNYLFRLDGETGELRFIPREEWAIPQMLEWTEADIVEVLDHGEKLLFKMLERLNLSARATIYRKQRSVGIIPRAKNSIPREALEEIVLNAQHVLQTLPVSQRVYFCAFNGGSDVWIDIGDKRYGVLSLQHYLNNIQPVRTLHVGDQFASIGANDFKARLAANTVWVASPSETREILDELLEYIDDAEQRENQIRF